jgi:hypothetical protein
MFRHAKKDLNQIAASIVARHPAMEAGIADHVWSLEEVIGLLE